MFIRISTFAHIYPRSTSRCGTNSRISVSIGVSIVLSCSQMYIKVAFFAAFKVALFTTVRFSRWHFVSVMPLKDTDIFTLNPFPHKTLKKVCSHNFHQKIGIYCIMLTMCFSNSPFAQSPPALLKNGHLFLSIFTERCHFFSGLL